MHRLILPTILCVLLLAGDAQAQTTRPALLTWGKLFEQFTSALTQSDPVELAALLGDDINVRAFDSRTADAVRLLARTRGGAVVFARSYQRVPDVLAAEVAESFRDLPVPDHLKQAMTPSTEAQMKRSNTIAYQWMVQMLAAAPDEPVGVIVFCCDHSAVAGTQEMEVVFVLVKGRKGDLPRFESIVYGDPQKRVF